MKIKIERPDDKKLNELNVSSWGIWGCDPSTFDWHYDEDETCYLLEGKVKVKTPDQEVEFGGGDMVTFPKGLDCTWTVIEKVRKHYKFG